VIRCDIIVTSGVTICDKHSLTRHGQQGRADPLPTPIFILSITLCCTHSPSEEFEHSKGKAPAMRGFGMSKLGKKQNRKNVTSGGPSTPAAF
jgi:hypothetical protein